MIDARGISRYQEADATSVGPEKLIVMLYEKLRDHLDRALQAARNNDPCASNDQINAAQVIIVELRNALDHSLNKEISLNLQRLYDYMIQENLNFLVDRQESHIGHVLRVLQPLLAAWQQVPPGAADQARRELAAQSPAEAAPSGPETAPSPPQEEQSNAAEASDPGCPADSPPTPPSVPGSVVNEDPGCQNLVSLTA